MRFSLSIRFVVFFVLVTLGQAWAQASSISDRVSTPHVEAQLLVDASEDLRKGGTVRVGLQLQHAPGWHSYWKNPGDSGLATQLTWTLPSGWSVAQDIAWPLPHRLPVGDMTNFGYEGVLMLPVMMNIAKAPQEGDRLRLDATWLVCNEVCIPEKGSFEVALPIPPTDAQHFTTTGSAPSTFPGTFLAQREGSEWVFKATGLPSTMAGQTLQVFPETEGLLDPSTVLDQSWRNGRWEARAPASASSDRDATSVWVVAGTDTKGVYQGWRSAAPTSTAIEAASTKDTLVSSSVTWVVFLTALGAALLGGLVLNLMPCVFPVLAIKVLGFAQHGPAVRAQRLSGLAYSAGVVLSFVALGALLQGLRMAGAQLGWGFQLQSPEVIAALAVLFTVMGLNLAGLFEFGMFAPAKLANMSLRHPAADAFLSGMLAVAIASPCTAPFMGASLGLAVGLPLMQSLAIFAALGVGMALPYLVASWVPGVSKCLPRPGRWMETFRKLMAFPMFLTVAWLVWVLGQQSGIDGAGSLLVLLVLLASFVWSVGLQGTSRRWLIGGCAALLLVAGAELLPNVVRAVPSSVKVTVNGMGREALADGKGISGHWVAWSKEGVGASLAEGRPVFVDFTASWCVTCQINKRTTLSNPLVLAMLDSKGVALMRADWTQQDPAITQELRLLGRSGIPVYALYTPNKEPVVLTELIGRQDIEEALATLP